MTVWIAVKCPGCHSTDVTRNGKTPQGKQRYICRNKECPRCTFIQDYTNNGYKPEVKQQIVDMSVNGSGVGGVQSQVTLWRKNTPSDSANVLNSCPTAEKCLILLN